MLRDQALCKRLKPTGLLSPEEVRKSRELPNILRVHCKSTWTLAVLVFLERKNLEYPKKNLSEQGENHQQTQPTCDAGTTNHTRATLVEELQCFTIFTSLNG
ncbi:uncharacterized protein [Montipora foliosa]|uniref:uncharacterized protein n=1 Tax=Montipora foliosa TaxID=591990 RepID=UPI0035F18A54